jgi:hypothetical protein
MVFYIPAFTLLNKGEALLKVIPDYLVNWGVEDSIKNWHRDFSFHQDARKCRSPSQTSYIYWEIFPRG